MLNENEKKREKEQTWCCWVLDREEIERAVKEICGSSEEINEGEVQQIVEDFKDAISIAFEDWEESLKEIVQNVKRCQNEM